MGGLINRIRDRFILFDDKIGRFNEIGMIGTMGDK